MDQFLGVYVPYLVQQIGTSFCIESTAGENNLRLPPNCDLPKMLRYDFPQDTNSGTDNGNSSKTILSYHNFFSSLHYHIHYIHYISNV